MQWGQRWFHVLIEIIVYIEWVQIGDTEWDKTSGLYVLIEVIVYM